ncbi:hypothetical protein [Limnoglobus roseus]|uniref:hypothetical protein n=1 Tax=Limnoglobus roseus TaxID=2598579 RepID=UPI0011EB5ED9|nr:hypothetical protein [Limnoglobus roseus]
MRHVSQLREVGAPFDHVVADELVAPDREGHPPRDPRHPARRLTSPRVRPWEDLLLGPVHVRVALDRQHVTLIDPCDILLIGGDMGLNDVVGLHWLVGPFTISYRLFISDEL